LQAAIVTLTARNRISRRDASELAGDLFQVGVSTGAVDAICQRASGLLAGPHQALVAYALGSGAINVDETGWFLRGENRTMWTATTTDAAVFRICEDRHADRLAELIGENFHGVVTSDRWWAYNLLDNAQRQACWSHHGNSRVMGTWRLGTKRLVGILARAGRIIRAARGNRGARLAGGSGRVCCRVA
jgi:transposase